VDRVGSSTQKKKGGGCSMRLLKKNKKTEEKKREKHHIKCLVAEQERELKENLGPVLILGRQFQNEGRGKNLIHMKKRGSKKKEKHRSLEKEKKGGDQETNKGLSSCKGGEKKMCHPWGKRKLL